MVNDEADEVMKELLDPLKNRYQSNLDVIQMQASDFLFDYLHLLHYKGHTINPNCGGSDKDSPD